ncbi:MAG TPA: LysE family transporter [Anaerolineales bacterium]|nr:LysE family transporter [Anaerolineales bacterium]HRF50582.1 LysE family transporter [Anaerolineales bacterium]
MLLTYLLQGLTLGFSACVSPGPYQAYLLGLASRIGWRRALPAAFAPLLSDGPVVSLVLVALTQLPEWWLGLLRLVGGLFCLWLGYGALKIWRAGAQATAPTRASIWQAVGVNLFSPAPWVFWSTIGGPILLAGWRIQPDLGLGFLAGFYVVLIGGTAALIGVFAGAARLGERVTRTLNGIAGLALIAFGLWQIASAL